MRNPIYLFVLLTIAIVGSLYGIYSAKYDDIHFIVFIICCFMALILFVILIYALLYFRKYQKHGSHPFHPTVLSEIFWTTIPFLILIALAFPAAMKLTKPLQEDKEVHRVESKPLTMLDVAPAEEKNSIRVPQNRLSL